MSWLTYRLVLGSVFGIRVAGSIGGVSEKSVGLHHNCRLALQVADAKWLYIESSGTSLQARICIRVNRRLSSLTVAENTIGMCVVAVDAIES